MVYKPEQKSQLQPLHHYISCHRSKPLSLQHLLCCWQLQPSNISSCSDTISISSEVHSLSKGHETWCLCFTAQKLTGETLQGDQHMPVTAEWAMAMSITISSRQLQCEPCFFVSLENQTNGLFLYMFIPQLLEIWTWFPDICRVHKELTTERLPRS